MTGPSRAATEQTPNRVPRFAGLQISATIPGPADAYAAMAAPCSVLNANRTAMFGAGISGTLVRAKRAVAMTNTGLRPCLSLAGPQSKAPKPIASCKTQPVQVCRLDN